jgi:fermentation-respiration switch protein FrsA (DUF1100 family)
MDGFISNIGALHLPVLAFTALAIVYADHQGLMYFLGKTQTLSRIPTHRIHVLVWAGLVGMLVTGVALLAPQWEFMLQRPEFYFKMCLVAVLIVNAVAIGKLQHIATERPFTLLTPEERYSLILSGALSGIGWVGAAIIGFFFL